MELALVIGKLYHDVDIVEVVITAWNGVFGGAVELYVGQGELERIAESLRGFPTSNKDVRELLLGTFDPKFAGGGASMGFFCLDRAGHIKWT